MFKFVAVGVLLFIIFAPSIHQAMDIIRNPEEYNEEAGIEILKLFVQPVITYDRIIGEQTDNLCDNDPYNDGGARMLIFVCSVLMITIFATISYISYAIFSILRVPLKTVFSYLTSSVSMVWLTGGLHGTWKFAKMTLEDAGINPSIPFSFGIIVISIVIFLFTILSINKLKKR